MAWMDFETNLVAVPRGGGVLRTHPAVDVKVFDGITGAPVQLRQDGQDVTTLRADTSGWVTFQALDSLVIRVEALGQTQLVESVQQKLAKGTFAGDLDTAVNGAIDRAEADGRMLSPDVAAFTYAPLGTVAGKVDKNTIAVDVRDYGAKGNGTADDTAALQAALDVPGPKRVLLSGVHKVTAKLVLRSDTTLDMRGATIRREFNTGPGGRGLIDLVTNAKNVTIVDGVFDGNGANFPAEPDGFNILTGVGVTDLRIERVTFLDVMGNHAIDLAGVDGLVVTRCRFLGFKNTPAANRGFSEAIQLDPDIAGGGKASRRVTVSDSYFGPSATAGFGPWPAGVGNHAGVAGQVTRDVTILRNTFEACGYAGVRPFRWDNTTIEGNTFTNCARGVLVSPLPGSPPVRGSGLVVRGNWFTNPTGQDALELPWVADVVVDGNVSVGGRNFLAARFFDGLTVTNNHVRNTEQNGCWFSENIETSFAGQGRTRDLMVTGNRFTNIGFRAIHVNGAVVGFAINGNTIDGAAVAAATRPAIAADTSASNGVLTGNLVLDGGAANKPTWGVEVSASCVSVVVTGNNLFKGVSNNATA